MAFGNSVAQRGITRLAEKKETNMAAPDIDLTRYEDLADEIRGIRKSMRAIIDLRSSYNHIPRSVEDREMPEELRSALQDHGAKHLKKLLAEVTSRHTDDLFTIFAMIESFVGNRTYARLQVGEDYVDLVQVALAETNIVPYRYVREISTTCKGHLGGHFEMCVEVIARKSEYSTAEVKFGFMGMPISDHGFEIACLDGPEPNERQKKTQHWDLVKENFWLDGAFYLRRDRDRDERPGKTKRRKRVDGSSSSSSSSS